MKKLLFVMAALLFFSTAQGSETSHRIAAVKLVEASKAQRNVDMFYSQMEAMIEKQFKDLEVPKDAIPILVKYQRKQVEATKSELSNFTDEFASAYMKVYTEEEIEDITRFYQSPAGVKFIDKMPELTKQMLTLVQSHVPAIVEKGKQIGEELARELEAYDKAKAAAAKPEDLPEKDSSVGRPRVENQFSEQRAQLSTTGECSSEINSEKCQQRKLALVPYNQGEVYSKNSDFERAIAEFTKAIELDPTFVEAYFSRGVAYGDKGEPERAIADFSKAIDLEPKLVQGYFNRGINYSNKEDYTLAIADFTKAIALKPDYAYAYYNRGNNYLGKDDFDHAIADYSKAIELEPNYSCAYNNRGFATKSKGNIDTAIADFSKAIELDPKLANAYRNRADAYSEKSDHDRAIPDYTKAIELGQDDGITSYNRGVAYTFKGDHDRAITDYTRAIALDPKFATAYYNRGNAYKSKNDWDRAIDDYGKAIELDPRFATAYNNRGTIYEIKGDYARAMADFTKAIEFDPEMANGYASRANAYRIIGDDDRAITDYTRAIELNPKDEYPYLWLLLTMKKVAKERVNDQLRELKSYIDTNNSTLFIRTISKYFLQIEEMTEEKVLQEAQRGKDEQEVREHLCEAYYYLGEERMLKGNLKGAKDFFQKCLQTAVYDFIEYQTAKATLGKLIE